MESYDLMSSDHFHVVLHPDREHGIIFNRLDSTVTTINYDDAKELSNLKLIARTYGIVGRFLDKYLVLIKSCSRVGRLFEPDSKTEHEIYVINQVHVIDISNVNPSQDSNISTNASYRSNDRSTTVSYETSLVNRDAEVIVEQHELKERQEPDEYSSLPVTISTNSYNSAHLRDARWNPFRLANSLKPIMPTQFLRSPESVNQTSNELAVKYVADGPGGSGQTVTTTDLNEQQQILDDADKRIAEEMVKLFNNTNSFYFSPTLDLTNRFSKCCTKIRVKGNEPLWKTANEKFFWNKYMLKDLIELSKDDVDANHFICIVLHGFISIEQQTTFSSSKQQYDQEFNAVNIHEDLHDGIEVGRLAIESIEWSPSNTKAAIEHDCDRAESRDSIKLDTKTTNSNISEVDKQQATSERDKIYQLALVSRRSVYQAGTRYRRRGCDERGNCANFVETEQIFRSGRHFTSVVIIRGSIPLFWYQTGYNYRPPPVLSRSEEENHRAFTKHFENLFHSYQTEQIISVDCTEHTGREKILHDAFRKHMNELAEIHSKLKLIEFDFHKLCRGRQTTDAQIEAHLRACGLTEQLLKDVKYYWNDGAVVCNQEGVFRVNCLDCCDRTNVVQRNINLQMLDLQLARLGVIMPDSRPEENIFRKIMQTMWSANGNVLSTQYCGTRALFGGDSRKLTGYLKDTYSSANRYYMSKFRDVYRQAAIDAMLGIEGVEAKDVKTRNVRDQYELLSFDPILAGSRQGGAILRDMGSRVGNRLARLRGKLSYVRPFDQISQINSQYHSTSFDDNSITQSRPRPAPSSSSSYRIFGPAGSGASYCRRDDSEIDETGLVENLGSMCIDWPTSETGDDCFQDDNDFGDLMGDY